jgi:hypothetical protein
MAARSSLVRTILRIAIFMLPAAAALHALADSADAALVKRALAAELQKADTSQHPLRYRLHKTSTHLSTTKEIIETKDGAVARLVAINDKPLGPEDEQKEQARLAGLLSDPSRQRHRKQAEDADTARVLKVLRALPDAFLYQFAGSGIGPTGKVEKFSFKPNPAFDPTDLETQALTAMSGELWVDSVTERVTRLEGHLQQDIDFGWGILGRLNKGGWIVIEQADIGNHQWRIVRFQMVMSGRVFFKTRSFDTTEEESTFTAMPPGMTYAQAIRVLEGDSAQPSESNR